MTKPDLLFFTINRYTLYNIRFSAYFVAPPDHREVSHLLPRTLIIYRDLWPNIKNNNQICIDDTLRHISGLSLEEVLIFTIFYLWRQEAYQGFFYTYEQDLSNKQSRNIFTLDKQFNFIKWISCNYREFREYRKPKEIDSLPSDEYEKFKFNPLISKPVLKPDFNPNKYPLQRYITPIPRLVYERVTRGLYFNFADYFRGESAKNPFRTAFGNVFQEYVSLLLKKSLGDQSVKSDWRYGSKKERKDTPDLLIIQEKRGILIEVKQSGLNLPAKTWGDLNKIKKALENTIGDGVNQMWKFENDIKSGHYSELEWLTDIEITERMVITYSLSRSSEVQ